MSIKTYSELITLPTFEERLAYLRIGARVGQDTFGYARWINQKFYKSYEYRKLRRDMIIRDNGCDLGIPGMQIQGPVYLHHMNPITVDDIIERTEFAWSPEYLILCSYETHERIHFAKESLLPKGLIERRPNDTCPWR